jgi:NAD(P)-dependent dehydrogenase (short-subunit alcohol dehydrogenase family)
MTGAAIVTGGGGAIGGAACDGLAERGFAVLVVDLDGAAAEAVAARIVAAGGTASACAADVSDEEAVAAYVRACVERHGAPRAFFNNAAAEGAIAPLSDYPTDVFDQSAVLMTSRLCSITTTVLPRSRRRCSTCSSCLMS